MQYRALALASLLSSSAFAVVIPAQPLSKRQTTIATFDPNGNCRVHFSDTKMNFGSINPLDVIKTLYDNCYDDGICNGGPYSVMTTIPSPEGSSTENVALTIELDGAFEPWVKNGLVEALTGAASQNGVISSRTTAVPNNAICATPPACPPITTTDLLEYQFPASLGISFANPDGGDPSFITMSFTLDSDSTGGACATVAEVGGDILDAVNGAGGTIFHLLGLFCD